MWIAGLLLPTSAVALLARLLEIAGHEELATRVGWAVDRNRRELRLSREERSQIAEALATACPRNLQALRRVLADDDAASAQRRAS